MFKAVEGIYRKGKIELAEAPPDVQDETPVIVTFLAPRYIDLRARGINEDRAAELRAKYAAFAEDWDSPEWVVQADDLQTELPQVIVAMITSRMSRAGHPSRVTVLRSTPAGHQSGLLTDSVVMTHNLATIAKTEIDRAIGRLPMADVDPALRRTLAL